MKAPKQTATIPDWRNDPILVRMTTRKNELAAIMGSAKDAVNKADLVVAERRKHLERSAIRVLAGLTDAGDEGSAQVALDTARVRQAEAHDCHDKIVGEYSAIDDELPRVIATARERVLDELMTRQREAVEEFAPAIEAAYAAQTTAQTIHAAILEQYSEGVTWAGYPVLAPGVDVGLIGLAFSFRLKPEAIARFKGAAKDHGCRV